MRVEKHIIKSTNKYYPMLKEYCHASKNLYNHANYIVRNNFFKEDKWIRYNKLDKILKTNLDYPDYKNMPTAQTAQQTLKLLDRNWKSYFKSIKDWSKNKDKYLGKPKPPKYLKKDVCQNLILTNQNCKLRDDIISFPKAFNGFSIHTKAVTKNNFKSFQQVRLIPRKNKIIAEVIYKINEAKQMDDNERYLGIDIGVNNLAVVCNNVGLPAFVINGKCVKSINQYYNKESSHYREICKRMNNEDYSRRMDSLTEKWHLKIEDYFHKSSKYIVDFCLENQINTIVIGQNKKWKQNSNLSKQANQSFVGIPFAKFITMIQYKANEKGIAVILTEESYTSGTSFIDDEEPIEANYNKNRRIKRGLFKSNKGILINADLNGAYQILKKVFPIKWDSGCALHPVVVDIV